LHYKYLLEQNPSTTFQYWGDDAQKAFIADRNLPVNFFLRKKSDVSFLITNKNWINQISIGESVRTKGYDLIRGAPVRDIAQVLLNDSSLLCDYKMKAILSTNDSTWTVALLSGSTNGGIIVTEELFYEAPVTGYKQEYIFASADQKLIKTKYVYLKSRDPVLYSRITLDYFTVDKSFVRLRGSSVTNP